MTQYTVDNVDDSFLSYLEHWERLATEVMIANGKMMNILDEIRLNASETFEDDPQMLAEILKVHDKARERRENGEFNKAKLSIEVMHDKVYDELLYLDDIE